MLCFSFLSTNPRSSYWVETKLDVCFSLIKLTTFLYFIQGIVLLIHYHLWPPSSQDIVKQLKHSSLTRGNSITGYEVNQHRKLPYAELEDYQSIDGGGGRAFRDSKAGIVQWKLVFSRPIWYKNGFHDVYKPKQANWCRNKIPRHNRTVLILQKRTFLLLKLLFEKSVNDSRKHLSYYGAVHVISNQSQSSLSGRNRSEKCFMAWLKVNGIWSFGSLSLLTGVI